MTIWCNKETAVQIVESGNRIFVQGACATPTPLLEALVERGEELHNVELTPLAYLWSDILIQTNAGEATSHYGHCSLVKTSVKLSMLDVQVTYQCSSQMFLCSSRVMEPCL